MSGFHLEPIAGSNSFRLSSEGRYVGILQEPVPDSLAANTWALLTDADTWLRHELPAPMTRFFQEFATLSEALEFLSISEALQVAA